MTEADYRKFWQEVYVAAIRNGRSTNDAVIMADRAVFQLRERVK